MRSGTAAQISGDLPRQNVGNSLKIVILIIVVALFVSLLHGYRRAPPNRPPEEEVNERTFIMRTSVVYENRGVSIWNLTEEDRIIGLFANNSWQMVYLMNYSLPLRSFQIDEDGNYIAVLDPQRTQVLPRTNLSYVVEYRIVTKPRSIPDIDEQSSLNLSDIPEKIGETFCRAEGPWLVNHPQIVDLTYRIVGNETRVLRIVKEFVRWIRGNIVYRSGDVPKYPNETLKEGFGDCDDQANLLITLCRVSGIPAHLQVGCIYLPSKTNETIQYWDGHFVTRSSGIGWHGWAIVYVPPWGWLPVDLTYAQNISGDPLNAVRRSALTLQETVQYLNITTTDYVASSISLRSLLKEHDFYIYEDDEMREELKITITTKGQEYSHLIAANPVVQARQGSW